MTTHRYLKSANQIVEMPSKEAFYTTQLFQKETEMRSHVSAERNPKSSFRPFI